MRYEKLVKTIDEQISMLKDRGLVVEDEAKLVKYLENISYYHLSIYFKHFQVNDGNFLEGTTFDDVLNIYIFDQKLRLLLSDILERIEKSFKAKLINKLSTKEGDAHWIHNVVYFKNSEHGVKIESILNDLKKSQEIYLKHFYRKYTESNYPPVWMIISSLTFGQSVLVYRQLTVENKEIIAHSYTLNKKFIESWFFAFSNIRNICAHHGRLWNREMTARITMKHPKYKDSFYNNNGNRLFNHVLLMYVINHNFTSASDWLDRLSLIIDEHGIEISHMGFPKDWKERILTSVQ